MGLVYALCYLNSKLYYISDGRQDLGQRKITRMKYSDCFHFARQQVGTDLIKKLQKLQNRAAKSLTNNRLDATALLVI